MCKLIYVCFLALISSKVLSQSYGDTIRNFSTFDDKVICKKIKNKKTTYQMGDSTLFVVDADASRDFKLLFKKGIINRSLFPYRHSGNINYYGNYYEWGTTYKEGFPPYIGSFNGLYIMISKPIKKTDSTTGYITYSFLVYYCYGVNEIFDEYEIQVNQSSLKDKNVKLNYVVYKGTPI